MIDLTDYTTIPSAVGLAVRSFVDRLPNINALMQDEPPLYDSMVRCRLENYTRPYRVPGLYKTLGSILDREEIVCYHATKVLFPTRIKSVGLRTNDWERYSNDIKEALIEGGVDSAEIEEALQCLKHEKERKDFDCKNRLCFFANPISFADEDAPGYDQFCQNVGGELARWSLKEYMPAVYNILRDSGESVLVKFSIPFNWIADYEKESIIAHFIYHEAAAYIWKYLYDIEFDGTLFQDVPTHSIIAINRVAIPEDYE